MVVYMEEIIEKTGGCGRFQIIVGFSVHFAKGFVCFAVLFMMFGGVVPDWWCVDNMDTHNTSLEENRTIDHQRFYRSCDSGNGTRSCNGFVFDSSIRTIVSEWSLVCDSTWKISTITSIQMAGLVVGNTLGGHSADAIGRKPTFLGAIIVNTILHATIIFVPFWILFAIFRFFIGVACGFQLTVMNNIQCEFAPTNKRSIIVTAPSWPTFMVIFALLCWLLQDWRYLHIATAGIGAVSVFLCCLATVYLEKLLVTKEIYPKGISGCKQEAGNYSPASSFVQECFKRLKPMRFSVGLATYGVQFGMSTMVGSFYVNVAIYSGLQIPMMLIMHFLQNSIFGRRRTFALYLSIFTVCAAIVAISHRFKVSEARNMASRVCVLVGISILSSAFSAMQTVTLEIYPTVVRNIGYGMQNTMARVGAIVGPQLAFLESMFPGMMYIVCTIFGILSITMLILLPETRGANLQDKLHEVGGNKTGASYERCDTNDAQKENTVSNNLCENETIT